MDKKVIAIVVTRNRLELLKRCVASLRTQTRKPDQIIIVDNASCDGTEQWLNALSCACDEIVNLRLNKNTGGAGGFSYGIEIALRSKPDYLWLMDDDGFPAVDCLENLLARSEIDIVGPLVVDEKDHLALAFGLGKNIKNVEDARNYSRDGVIKGVVNPFNGTLVSAALIKKIGNIKAEMFIWGDETEYVYRAIKAGASIYTAVKAIHYHPACKSKIIRLIGNRFCIEVPPEGLRAYCRYRNYAYIYINYNPKRMVVEFIKYTIYYLVVKRCDINGYIKYLQATFHGIIGKWGEEKKYII